MAAIEVKKYKNDPKSFYSYLWQAKVKEISFQHTGPSNLKLLDIVFESTGDDSIPAELLIRLETPMSEINAFLNKLIEAIDHPKPHPWDEDLFDKAVTGKTVRELNEELMNKYVK